MSPHNPKNGIQTATPNCLRQKLYLSVYREINRWANFVRIPKSIDRPIKNDGRITV